MKIDALNETLDKKYLSRDVAVRGEILSNLAEMLPSSTEVKSREQLLDYYTKLESNLEQVRNEIEQLKREAFEDMAYINQILGSEEQEKLLLQNEEEEAATDEGLIVGEDLIDYDQVYLKPDDDETTTATTTKENNINNTATLVTANDDLEDANTQNDEVQVEDDEEEATQYLSNAFSSAAGELETNQRNNQEKTFVVAETNNNNTTNNNTPTHNTTNNNNDYSSQVYMTPAESWQTLVNNDANNNANSLAEESEKLVPQPRAQSANTLDSTEAVTANNVIVEDSPFSTPAKYPLKINHFKSENDGNQTELDEEPIEDEENTVITVNEVKRSSADDAFLQPTANVLSTLTTTSYKSEDNEVISSTSFYSVNETVKCVTEEEKVCVNDAADETQQTGLTKTKKVITELVKTTVYSEQHNTRLNRRDKENQATVPPPLAKSQTTDFSAMMKNNKADLHEHVNSQVVMRSSALTEQSSTQQQPAAIRSRSTGPPTNQRLSTLSVNSTSQSGGVVLNKNVLDKFVRQATTDASASLLNLTNAGNNNPLQASSTATTATSGSLTKTSSSNLLTLCGPLDNQQMHSSPESSTTTISRNNNLNNATNNRNVLRSSMNIINSSQVTANPNRFSNQTQPVIHNPRANAINSVQRASKPTHFESQLESILNNGTKNADSSNPDYRVPSSRHFCGRLMSTNLNGNNYSTKTTSSASNTSTTSSTNTQIRPNTRLYANNGVKYSSSSASPSGSSVEEVESDEISLRATDNTVVVKAPVRPSTALDIKTIHHHHHHHHHHHLNMQPQQQHHRSQNSLSTTSSPSTASSSPRSASSHHLANKNTAPRRSTSNLNKELNGATLSAAYSSENVLQNNQPMKSSYTMSAMQQHHPTNKSISLAAQYAKSVEHLNSSTLQPFVGSIMNETFDSTASSSTATGDLARRQTLLKQKTSAVLQSHKDISSILMPAAAANPHTTNGLTSSVSNKNIAASSATKPVVATEMALSKSIRDLKVFVSNSFSPSLIVKPPPGPAVQHRDTPESDDPEESYLNEAKAQMHDDDQSSTTNLSSVSNRINNPPQVAHHYQSQQQVPPPPPRTELITSLKKQILNPPKPLIKTVATNAAVAKLGGEKPLIQTNLDTYKKFMVQPLKDEKSNQVRIEFLQQQAMISKMQKQELKEYLVNKEMLTQHLQQTSPVKQMQRADAAKDRNVVVNNNNNNSNPVIRKPSFNNTSLPMGAQADVNESNKNDRLINCILEMKAPQQQQQQQPVPRPVSVDNQRIKADVEVRKSVQANSQQQQSSQQTPRTQMSNLTSLNNNIQTNRNFHMPTIKKQVSFRRNSFKLF